MEQRKILSTESTTIPQLIRNVIEHIKSPDDTFLLSKKQGVYTPVTFQQTLDNANALSAWLLSKGIKKGDRIGLLIENSPTYVFLDQALQQIGAINVSIYPTLSEGDIAYIMQDAGISLLLVGSPFLMRKILKNANQCNELNYIIPAFDAFSKVIGVDTCTKTIIAFDEILSEGQKLRPAYQQEIDAIRNSLTQADIAALIYTSGTTGSPKGAMLTHGNFVNNTRNCLKQVTQLGNNEVLLSFLPLSHVFERTGTYMICCTMGCKLAFAEGLEQLAKNMVEVQPTLMMTVPRMLERISEKAVKAATGQGGIKALIFNWAMAVGKKHRETREQNKPVSAILRMQLSIAEKFVFSKIKAKTGGRLNFLISGGSALSKSVGEFFGNIGIPVLEGYGLTETSPVIAITEYDRRIINTVGRVVPNVEVGIQNPDTKEIYTIQTHDSINHNFESQEGEIIVRGHIVMKGYWNKPEDTAAIIDSDGWLHTGDVGKFSQGCLKITDRIKNIIVNAYGKNIYPTQIENIYLKSPKIDQIFLVGDNRDYISAIIVPSKENLMETFGVKEQYFVDENPFIEDEFVINWINDDIKTLSSELSKFEQVKSFRIKRNPFTLEDGEMTPTLKAKRKVIEKKYAETIDKLYE